MADVKINDLTTAAVSSTMQLETDIGGTLSNKIDIASLTSYLETVLPISDYSWSVVNSATALVTKNGYITNSGATIVFTLPVTAVVGDSFKIISFSAGGWQINQNSGQSIRLGNQTTTAGIGGSCASTQLGDCVEVICVNADTDFVVVSSMGNILLT